MLFSRLSMVVVAVAAMVSTSAFADTITLTDKVASGVVNSGCTSNCTAANWYTPVNGYQQTITTGPAWAIGQTFNFGDIVGGSEFDIKKLVINRNATNVVFTITTNYSGSDSYGTKYADIFIDTVTPQGPDSWNYAIALGSSYTRDGVAAGLYQVNSSNYLTSDQVWANQGGYGIGGLVQMCTPGDNLCTGPAPGYNGVAVAPATLLNNTNPGTLVGSVLTNKVYNSITNDYTITVTVTPNNMAIFAQFDVLVGSADCANDALWGTVTAAPAPAGLGLLGLGLFGLVGVRRRRAA